MVVSGLWILKKGWQVFACLQPCWLKWLMGSRAIPLFLCRKHSHQGTRDKSAFVLTTTAENRRPWHPSRSIATCIGSYRQCSVCLQYLTEVSTPPVNTHKHTHPWARPRSQVEAWAWMWKCECCIWHPKVGVCVCLCTKGSAWITQSERQQHQRQRIWR